MKTEEWNTLKAGDVINSKIDGRMLVAKYDFYGDGTPITCLCSIDSIYPQSEFSSSDWNRVCGDDIHVDGRWQVGNEVMVRTADGKHHTEIVKQKKGSGRYIIIDGKERFYREFR